MWEWDEVLQGRNRKRGAVPEIPMRNLEQHRGCWGSKEWKKKDFFSPFTPFVQKGTGYSPSKNSDGRPKGRGCDLSLVLHLSRSCEEAEAPASPQLETFQRWSPMGSARQPTDWGQSHPFTWRRSGVGRDQGGVMRRQRWATRNAEESYPPEIWGIPQESCQTMELVTARHLLVGLYIAQFRVSLNSNSCPCSEFTRYLFPS